MQGWQCWEVDVDEGIGRWKEKKRRKRGGRRVKGSGGGGEISDRGVFWGAEGRKNEKSRDWSEKIIEAVSPPAAGGL